MNADHDDNDDRVDLSPLYGAPDPARLERLTRRITASVTSRRRPRSVMEQLAAWAPFAVGLALVVAALAWVPALVAPPASRGPASLEAALLERAFSGTSPRAGRALWFTP